TWCQLIISHVTSPPWAYTARPRRYDWRRYLHTPPGPQLFSLTSARGGRPAPTNAVAAWRPSAGALRRRRFCRSRALRRGPFRRCRSAWFRRNVGVGALALLAHAYEW